LNNFISRSTTAIFIVIFILGGFWLHPYSFLFIGLVLVCGTQYEYYRMIISSGINPQLVPGMIMGIAVYTISSFVASGLAKPHWMLLLIAFASIIMIIELYRKQERPFDSIAHTLFSVLYSAVPISIFPFSAFSHSGLDPLIKFNTIEFSPGIVVGFFLLLWANDTGAYLVGVTIGKHRLMERISPKKSWEGFFGGMLITLAAAWFLAGWLGVVSRTGWLIISLIISITGTYGDLVESMLKRSLGIKDSGSIMPGHGGFLDRFDSVLISFPLVYLYISLFG
jgi:phosphatidate cytidylyltransferase